MNARVVTLVVLLASGAIGCTAFIAAELSGDQTSPGDGGSGSDVSVSNDCFMLPSNQCGACIENSCENPNGSPPVSLKAVCNLDQTGEIVAAVQDCVSAPDFSNTECSEILADAGTAYASSIATAAAADNNLLKCIGQHCATSCSECAPSVPTCQSQSIALSEAGACGVCLDNAMNRPGSPCQSWVLQGGCADESTSSPVAQCAPPSGQCTPADCSQLQSPSSDYDDAGYGLLSCLWQQCQSSCPNH